MDENANADDKGAAADNHDAEGRNGPGHRGARGPAKEEEAYGETKDAEQPWPQICFWRIEAVELAEAPFGRQAVPEAVPQGAQNAGDENADEDGGGIASTHAIDFGVNEWKHFKERVVYAVGE